MIRIVFSSTMMTIIGLCDSFVVENQKRPKCPNPNRHTVSTELAVIAGCIPFGSPASKDKKWREKHCYKWKGIKEKKEKKKKEQKR